VLVTFTHEALDARTRPLRHEHLDEQETRGVAIQVQPGEGFRLIAFDVEYEEIDLGRSRLVDQRTEGPARYLDVVVRFATAACPRLDVGPICLY
jgi:hypothetical protein